MKKLILGLLALSSLTAFASDRHSCTYDAKIISIEKMGTLNKGNGGNGRLGTDDYTYIAKMELTNGRNPSGSNQVCRGEGEQQIILEEDKKYDYSIGDELIVVRGGGSDRGGLHYSYLNEVRDL